MYNAAFLDNYESIVSIIFLNSANWKQFIHAKARRNHLNSALVI